MRLLLALILLIGLSAQAQITISNATLSGVTSGSALLATANNFTASNTFSSGMMIWGDANKTNGVLISPSGEVLSNAVGSVTIAGGNVTASGTIKAAGITNTALTASRIVLTDANGGQSSAVASGSVPVNADGSAALEVDIYTGAGSPTIAAGTPQYGTTGGGSFSATEANVSLNLLEAGTLYDLEVKTVGLGAGTNTGVIIMTNGGQSPLFVTYLGSGANQYTNNTTTLVSHLANTTVSLMITGAPTSSYNNIRYIWKFRDKHAP